MKTKKKYIAPSLERFLYQAEEGFALSQLGLSINGWNWEGNDNENSNFNDEGGDGYNWDWD